jgi:hypothetical protein
VIKKWINSAVKKYHFLSLSSSSRDLQFFVFTFVVPIPELCNQVATPGLRPYVALGLGLPDYARKQFSKYFRRKLIESRKCQKKYCFVFKVICVIFFWFSKWFHRDYFFVLDTLIPPLHPKSSNELFCRGLSPLCFFFRWGLCICKTPSTFLFVKEFCQDIFDLQKVFADIYVVWVWRGGG